MDKDLHSYKVEDWNVVFKDDRLYLFYEDGVEIRVKSGYWIGKRKVKKMNKEYLPIEVLIEDGNMTWARYSDGYEYRYRYDDKYKVIWTKFPTGEEHGYDEGGRIIWRKYNNGYEYRYDEKGNVIWSKHPIGHEYRYDGEGRVIWMKNVNGGESYG